MGLGMDLQFKNSCQNGDAFEITNETKPVYTPWHAVKTHAHNLEWEGKARSQVQTHHQWHAMAGWSARAGHDQGQERVTSAKGLLVSIVSTFPAPAPPLVVLAYCTPTMPTPAPTPKQRPKPSPTADTLTSPVPQHQHTDPPRPHISRQLSWHSGKQEDVKKGEAAAVCPPVNVQ